MEKQHFLLKEALNIINELRLFEILKKVGETHLVGSVALKTIVKKNIDVHVLLQLPFSQALQVLKQALPETHCTQYTKKGAYKIDLTHKGWDIEVWLSREPLEAVKITRYLQQNMTNKERDRIIKIKRAYHERGLLRNSVSTLVYIAVMDHGVASEDEFQVFLSQHDRQEILSKFCEKHGI